jgi:phage tail sheath protein FI
MTETAYEDAVDWRKNVQAFNSYRAALSSPWIKTYDSVQGRANFVMCPSAYVAKIMGAYEPWQAPAGLNRGILSSSVVSPTGLTQYYNDTLAGNLYTDNQINCVLRNVASGYVNWGQRTLQQKPSALDRINVARTVIYIETILRDAALWHVFENNTAYERMQITLQFNAFLDQVLSSEGIQAYRVICDESNNTPTVIANNQLKIDIILWPTYTAEYIIITSTVAGADTSVTVSTSGN